MDHREEVRREFARVAGSFGERTRGRFDQMGPVEFSRAQPGAVVCEVGAGTGNFLDLFREVAGVLIAVDLTPEMLHSALDAHPGHIAIVADGMALPLASGAVDLACCAQTIHHVPEPVRLIAELGRITKDKVLVVDQVSTEDPGEIAAMNQLESLRDPSHAASRPPSAYRQMLEQAGLKVIDTAVHESVESLDRWMSPEEFPQERIAAVRRFIDEGPESGMRFEDRPEGLVFLRRRMMLLGEPQG